MEAGCRASDLELLLCEWLDALACQVATRRSLLGEFHVRGGGEALEATALGAATQAGLAR
jgi:SHS2 domain-containing protein